MTGLSAVALFPFLVDGLGSRHYERPVSCYLISIFLMVYGPDIVTSLSAVVLFLFLVDGLGSIHCDRPVSCCLISLFS